MNITIRGKDAAGKSVSEVLEIPEGGRATTVHGYSEYSIDLPASGGDNATIIFGAPWHDLTPRRRRTRSGRSIYGAWPKRGRGLWTGRPDDKLERRRVRSRIAHAKREMDRRTVVAEFIDEQKSFHANGSHDDISDLLRSPKHGPRVVPTSGRMLKAKFIKTLETPADTNQALYECEGGALPRYVVVSATTRYVVETYIFPADRDGNITDWSELAGSYKGGLDHEEALRGAGYEIASA